MKKEWALLAAILALAVALAACAGAAPPTPTPTKAPAVAPTTAPAAAATPTAVATKPAAAPTATPRPATLKHGTIASAGDAGTFLAVEKGYFKEQGINVEIVPITTPQMIPSISTGQIDSLIGPFSQSIMNALDRGIELRTVGNAGMSMPKWEWGYIALRKDLADSGQVKTPKDLKGMKVAIASRGGMAEQSVGRMMEQAGLKLEDVELVLLPQTEQLVGLANKGIAAGWLLEPLVTQAAQQGLATKWQPLSQVFGGPTQIGVLLFGPNLLKDPDLGRRWMVATMKGVRDYNKAFTTGEGRAQVVDALVKYTSIKDPKMYDVMAMPYLDPNGSVDRQNLDLQYKWLVDNGLYTGKKTMNDLLDLSFIEYAAKTLGKQ